MSRGLLVEPREAVGFLGWIAGWGEGFAPVFLDGALRPEMHARLAKGGARRLAERAARWDFEASRQVEIGLPMRSPDSEWVERCSVLWTWADTPATVRRAARWFPHRPSLVLRMGRDASTRLLMWALDERERYDDVVAANKRVAYALGAPQKWAAPEKLRIPLPGTFLRVDRKKPVPVLVTLMEADRVYSIGGLVGRLRDPPPADGWKERKISRN